MDDLPLGSVGQVQQLAKESMNQRFLSRSAVKGEISLPAVPGLIDEYVRMCAGIFAGVGRKFSDDEITHLRSVLEGQLATAYSSSPRSHILISYNASVGSNLNYEVNPRWWTVEAAYEDWISTREPPLFGTEPDARVWALANEAADPASHPILDIGAGNRAQRTGFGAPWTSGRRGGDDPVVRLDDSLRRRTRIPRHARHQP